MKQKKALAYNKKLINGYLRMKQKMVWKVEKM